MLYILSLYLLVSLYSVNMFFIDFNVLFYQCMYFFWLLFLVEAIVFKIHLYYTSNYNYMLCKVLYINVIFNFSFLFFWFLIFMHLILLYIVLLTYKKRYNNLKFYYIITFYVLLFSLIIILFYLEDLLLFILLFESILFLLLLISIHFVFTNKFILAVYYLIVFSVLSSIFCFFTLILFFVNNVNSIILLNNEYMLFNNINILLYVWLFIFIVFAIKFPTFPFFFWLLSVHVEVSSEISIFLASIILKAGFIGVFKFLFVYMNFISYFFINVLVLIILYGLIFITLNLLLILDYKKILGSWSIIHVNLGIIILWYNNNIFTLIFLFSSLNHILSSGSFFAIIGYFYENLNNKTLFIINGFLGFNIFSVLLLLLTLSNLNFPFFLMFYLEIFTFYSLYVISFYLVFILVVINLTLFMSSLVIYFMFTFYNLKWLNILLKLDISIHDFILLKILLLYNLILYWFIYFI